MHVGALVVHFLETAQKVHNCYGALVVHFLETAQKVHHACGALFGNSTKSAPCKCPFISSAPKVYRYVRVVLLLFHIKCTNTPVNFWCGFAQAAPKAFQYVCVASVLSHMECTQIRKYCCSLELVANQGAAPASFGLLNKKVRTHGPRGSGLLYPCSLAVSAVAEAAAGPWRNRSGR